MSESPGGATATIFGAALTANLSALGAGPDSVIDLRHDAWGHGVVTVAQRAHALGVIGAVCDTPETPPGFVSAAPESVSLPPAAVLGLEPNTVPVMRLSGTVLSVKSILAGEGVSYGHTFLAASDSRIALVTGGYAQGVVRALGNHVRARVNGHDAPVVGRVAMDVCVLDIGDAAVSRGDEVVFFGDPARDEPALSPWVTATHLQPGELVTLVGLRSRRVVIG